MKKHELRFRQVHLDFHTSPAIFGIGEKFDKKEWQDLLKIGHVDSITCFSVCHHGWCYHPTEVGETHPHLNFNLLRAQMDACREIDVKVPVYVSGGFNQMLAERHPEWRIVIPGRPENETAFFHPRFFNLCFNSPYMDHLCRQLIETTRMFPDANGIFIDIINQAPCACRYCLESMRTQGYDPESPDDRAVFARRVLMEYYRRATEAIHSVDPDMPVFHNAGHIKVDDHEILKYFSHLELESLPTGGWGYDHFPMSAAYSRNLGMDFLGMTGKFHRTWGEFGGFKHPNALRYECAAMIANNAKCSVGDQLHPSGQLDRSTYSLIGDAYREVELCEPWCRNAESAAAVAVLGAADNPRMPQCNTGAARFLLESHVPFDLVDSKMDFSRYAVLVVADEHPLDPGTLRKIEHFVAAGGRVVLCGRAGLDGEGSPATKLLDAGEFSGTSPFAPDYICPAPDFTGWVDTPFLMQLPSERLKVKSGRTLGAIYDTPFNRSFEKFCSHQHTPFSTAPSGFDAGFLTKNVLYFAHPVFLLYCLSGAAVTRDYMSRAFTALTGAACRVEVSGLPSGGRVTLMRQPDERRYVLHLLYAPTSVRGAVGELPCHQRPAAPVEVIEDLVPLSGICCRVTLPEKIRTAVLQPEEHALALASDGGTVCFTVERFTCHAMIELTF